MNPALKERDWRAERLKLIKEEYQKLLIEKRALELDMVEEIEDEKEFRNNERRNKKTGYEPVFDPSYFGYEGVGVRVLVKA